jgi:PIN domain nuclease of toxin-antitoxin system
MRYIIDTQAFIWYAIGDSQLSKTAREIIESNDVRYISIASIWEMAIKSNTGKLTFQVPFDQLVSEQLAINGYEILPLDLAHVFQLANLPLHHKDPFDRILISQAMNENIPIVSVDAHFKNYPITVIW